MAVTSDQSPVEARIPDHFADDPSRHPSLTESFGSRLGLRLSQLGWSSARDWLIVVGLLGVALLIRLPRTVFGLPYLALWDERQIILPANVILTKGDWNPHFFNYGSLPIYLTAVSQAVAFILASSRGAFATETLDFYSHLDFHGLIMTNVIYLQSARVAFVLASAITVGLVYIVGKRIGGWVAGLVGAAFVAVAPMHVEYGSRLSPDILAAACSAACVYACVRIVQGAGDGRWYIVAALAAALTMATKYNSALVVLTIPVAHLLVPRPKRRDDLWLWGSLAVVGLAFLAVMPFALLDFPEFVRDVGSEAFHYGARGHAGFEAEPGITQLLYYVNVVAGPGGLGLVAVGFAFVGTVLALRLQPSTALVLLTFPAALLMLMVEQRVHFDRNALPLLPELAALAGLGAARLPEIMRPIVERLLERVAANAVRPRSTIAWCIVALLVLVRVVPAFASDNSAAGTFARYRTTQYSAEAWLTQHYPNGGTIALPSELPWDYSSLKAHGWRIVTYPTAHPPSGSWASANNVTVVLAALQFDPLTHIENQTSTDWGRYVSGAGKLAKFGTEPVNVDLTWETEIYVVRPPA